ncbi:MAG TPA: hypothetical protein PLJ12_07790, partial [Planctomycetota bacterium]|nr:hypothetical protein [Planctomycetota bacterium]
GVSTAAQVAERGELMAAASGALSMGFFLKARQDRAPRIMLAAVLLALVAAFAGRIAYLLPPLAGLLEFLSARRHRPIGARLRTALVTAVVCLALVSIEWVLRHRFAPETLGPPLGPWRQLGGVALALEKLGVLLLPVDTYGIGKVGYALAVIALLLALHPGFVAARSAPRLWGRILLGWAAALILAEVYSLGRRVEPGSLAGSQVLFPATFVMAVGSAIAATAIHGVRRTLIPAVVCVAFALLGRGHARPFERAADRVTELRRNLVEQAQARDWKTGFFLLDFPDQVAGARPLEGAVRHLLDPMFLYEVTPRPPRQPWLGAGNAGAFALFSAEPEFRRQCQRGLVVLGAEDWFDGPPANRSASPLQGIEVGLFPTAARPLELVGSAGEEDLQFHALTYRQVQLTLANTRASEEEGPPVLRWKSETGLTGVNEVFGLWRRHAGGATEAVFDLSHHLAWLLGGEISALWLPGHVGEEQSLRLARDPESLPPEVVPRRVGNDWVFDVSRVNWPQDLAAPQWYLELLDLDFLRYAEFDLGPSQRGRLSAPGMAEWTEGLLKKGQGPLVWRLEARVDGVTMARARGRRELGP